MEEFPTFEQSIAGYPNVAPPPTIAKIIGLCNTSAINNYENEKMLSSRMKSKVTDYKNLTMYGELT